MERRAIRITWLAAVILWVWASAAGAADLLVSNQDARTISRYDGATGAFVSQFAAGFGDPLGMVFGPDGHLYACDGQTNQVNRYDGASGALLGTFTNGGPLGAPIDLAFGPDGNLYVCSASSDVLRYDGSSGAFIDAFVPSGSGGLSYSRSLSFGPDGNLYVASWNTASILRYDGVTGAFLGAFVPAGSGGLATPSGMCFGPDGNLYVTGGYYPEAGVRRYDGTTGAFIGMFGSFPSGYTFAVDVAFGPDGRLYVTAQAVNSGVYRFDGTTGAFIDYFVPEGSGGLYNPFGLAFFPGPPPPPTCVDVVFEVQPRVLNLRSKGRWITGYIRPAAPWRASQIDVASIRLNESVPVSSEYPVEIDESDSQLKAKFSRAELAPTLDVGDNVGVRVTGTIGDRCLYGYDSIRVIDRGIERPGAGEVVVAGTSTNVVWDPSGEQHDGLTLLASFDDGATWNIQAEPLANSGHYAWMVPQVATEQARLAIVVAHEIDGTGVIPGSELAESESFTILTSTAGVEGGTDPLALRVANPMVGEFTVQLGLAADAPARLLVCDVSGRMIASRDVDDRPGMQSLRFGHLATGVYVVRLTQAGRSVSRRVVVIR